MDIIVDLQRIELTETMPSTVRLSKLTKAQKAIFQSLLAGHRVRLQFSVLTGAFTDQVRFFNTTLCREELVPWYRISAMLERGLLRLDGSSIDTSTELIRAVEVKP